MIRIFLVLLALACPAYAQNFPALYDVDGVGDGDTLNVRRGPAFDAEAFDALAADAKRIEVVEQNGKWFRINRGEQSGWVASRYMTPNQGEPAQIACGGTEPFWSLTKTAEGPYRLRILGDYNMAFTPLPTIRSANDTRVMTTLGKGNPGQLQVIQRQQSCNDGMSDAKYGLAIDLILTRTEQSEQQLYSGCCALR
ncbi:SH3 domain-containing protein [Nereida sp. MMG025]|uniref:SH3 domain-containing protein n=1 Tax=Nereida sp. MMG025 TaxID=2909981 RepID=UPI001F1916C2|nr:SH3 domain-containing protein [Nereida sp. MMG025]MCF6444561.1 SH3 domain-containing protein [Nereida sp. MMG025]